MPTVHILYISVIAFYSPIPGVCKRVSYIVLVRCYYIRVDFIRIIDQSYWPMDDNYYSTNLQLWFSISGCNSLRHISPKASITGVNRSVPTTLVVGVIQFLTHFLMDKNILKNIHQFIYIQNQINKNNNSTISTHPAEVFKI